MPRKCHEDIKMRRINMKKAFFYLILFFIFCNIYSQGSAKLWTKLYRQARSIKQKRDKVKEMSEIATNEFQSLIMDILEEQISYGAEKVFYRKKDHEEWIYYTSVIVGNLKLKDGAVKLSKLIDHVENPVMKGEMFYTIAKTDNKNLLPWLNQKLKEYNLEHELGRIGNREPVVYGLLKALDLFKNRSSFKIIFYAAIPNYSEPTRNLASKTLKAITTDPALFCKDILREYKNKMVRLEALKYAYYSDSSNEDKAEVAISALFTELGTLAEDNNYERNLKKDIENLAIQYIGELKTQNNEAVVAIEQKWDRDKKIKDIQADDTVKMLKMIDALRMIGSDGAVTVLTKKLAYFNFKAAEDFGTGYGEKEGIKILLAIIKSLGNIGKNVEKIVFNQEETSTYFELEKARYGGFYEKVIVQEAKIAVEKLNK